MNIIPAVDIRDGKCAQLIGGAPGTEKYYGDPVEIAKKWEKEGAKCLHVIDLDAAIGDDGENFAIAKRIVQEVNIPCQFGGGVRSIEHAKEVLDAGFARVIIGSMAVNEPEVVKMFAKDVGPEHIIIALDSRGGEILTHGWKDGSGLFTAELIDELKPYCYCFLITDVDKEGKMEGIDVDEFSKLAMIDALLCASGGISSEEDIKTLETLGLHCCILGKALYEGKIPKEVLRD